MRYLILLLLALPACRPDACLDGSTAIIQGVAMDCHGLDGCSSLSGDVVCDTREAVTGQECAEDGRLWCDGDDLVFCDGGEWVGLLGCSRCSTGPLRCT